MASRAVEAPSAPFAAVRPAPLGEGALLAAVALGVALGARGYGAYEPSVWGPLGIALVAVAAVLVVAGRRPAPAAGAASLGLLAYGAWAAGSTVWGGLPTEAWHTLDRALVAVAALAAGSMLAVSRRGAGAVAGGVLAGLSFVSVEIVARTAAGSAPGWWFHGRYLDGPAGYHNAQAAAHVLALVLAAWLATTDRAAARAAGGGLAGLHLAVLGLTQSRSGVVAAGVALVAFAALHARARLVILFAGLIAAGVALLPALRSVDAALVESGPAGADDALAAYAFRAAVVCVGLAALAAVDPGARIGGRRLAQAGAVVAVAGIVWAAVSRPPALEAASPSALWRQITSDADPDRAPPGGTRLADVSLNGRWDAWRVAARMAVEEPAQGHGVGRYAGRWTIERRSHGLDILQPHSLELEVIAELGAVGLALAFVAAGSLLSALRRSSTPALAAAAGAALGGLLAQASVDWTASFPGIVAPALLVAGAAAGGVEASRRRAGTAVAAVGLAAVSALLIALPYLADRHLAEAVRLSDTDVVESWRRASGGLALDPWNARAHSVQGRLAEAAGEYRLAAQRYGRAAELTPRPWIDHFRRGRALTRAGLAREARAACHAAWAANPREPALRRRHCARP